MTDRNAYVENLKAKLDEWNARAGEVEAKMREASDDARARYEAQLAEMRRAQADAEARLEELRASSGEEWERNRRRFEEAWSDISAGFGRAWSRFF